MAKRKRSGLRTQLKNRGLCVNHLALKKGEKIPVKKLRAAAKKPGKMGQRARLAITLRGFKKRKKRKK